MLPVIRDVNAKTLESLQSDIAAVAASVRAGTLKPEQMTGGCMAFSNLGMYPVETFEGIIFPGHSSILTVGAARDTPVVMEGRVEIRPSQSDPGGGPSAHQWTSCGGIFDQG